MVAAAAIVAALVPATGGASLAAVGSLIVVLVVWWVARRVASSRASSTVGVIALLAVPPLSFVVVALNSPDLAWVIARGESCGTIRIASQTESSEEPGGAGRCFVSAFEQCEHRSLQLEAFVNSSGAFDADLSISAEQGGCHVRMRWQMADLNEPHQVDCGALTILLHTATLSRCSDQVPIEGVPIA